MCYAINSSTSLRSCVSQTVQFYDLSAVKRWMLFWLHAQRCYLLVQKHISPLKEQEFLDFGVFCSESNKKEERLSKRLCLIHCDSPLSKTIGLSPCLRVLPFGTGINIFAHIRGLSLCTNWFASRIRRSLGAANRCWMSKLLFVKKYCSSNCEKAFKTCHMFIYRCDKWTRCSM